jgi:hypothetical protein
VLRELVGELEGDAAAEAVTRDRGGRVAEGEQEVPDHGGVGSEGVVATRGVGLAVPGEVDRDHGVCAGERADHAVPGPAAVAETVDEHQGFPGSDRGVGDGPARQHRTTFMPAVARADRAAEGLRGGRGASSRHHASRPTASGDR